MNLLEIFSRPSLLSEGGNLAIGDEEAQQIDLKIHKRAYIIPILDDLLKQINASFQKATKQTLWNPALLQNKKFLSGSSLHFFNTSGISDEVFFKKKPKVGDIDTMVPKDLEPALEKFLTSIQGKTIGNSTLVGFKRGNEQFSSLWALQDPPIKVQIDLEFVEYEKDEPSDWSRFSHSSSWDDLEQGVKGVFHKWMINAFTSLTAKDFILRKVHKTTKKVTDTQEHDSMISFAVSSKEGGGLRAKYAPVMSNGKPLVINGLPVMEKLPPAGYEKNIGAMFQTILKHRVNEKAIEQALPKTWSFVGLLDLANAVFNPNEKQQIVDAMIEKCFGKGAQGLYKGDPDRDEVEKMAALKLMFQKLGVNPPGDFEQVKREYKSRYKVTDESFIREADEKPAVKAQLRKGMPHLHDLKAVDFLDLIDELHDGNGKFKLENIPLNVKVDGFGGRFGKNAEGKPFMGTSRTEPRYEPGFVAHHQKKGTTDPDILNRAQLFDDLFEEMMEAIKLVDAKLGPDFLVNKQVSCEVLFLPFATETPEGKLKFVGIHYDKLPKGVQLALVPFHAVDADTGEPVKDPKFIDKLLQVGQQGSVMFINNRLTQKQGLDVTEIINPLDNIEELKSIVSSTAGKRDRASVQLRNEVEEKLQPIKDKLEQAIIKDPNIVGKDMLGKNYEGIVINSRLGPIKVTSQEQRDVIQAKKDAMANARTERPRGENKTAVVAVGSFVGHVGHEQLFDYTIKKAAQVGGDPYLFIGNAQGKDDPIPPAVKVETWHKMYPQYAKNISTVTQEGGTLMQKIKHELINPLPGKPPRYDNIIIMVGEDQAKMPIAQALMKAVNKFQGYEHVKVHLETTPRGTGMSFTKLRNILKDPNATPQQQLQVWEQGFDVKKLGREWIMRLMDLTRKGMGIQATKETMAGVGMQDNPERNAVAYESWKGGKRVNNCVPVGEDIEKLMAGYIKILESK
jgi:hypothetical protein